MSGFPEWLPEQELVQQRLISIVRTQYELHGFAPIRTRSVERLEDLLSKGGDADKEIYVLQRLVPDRGRPEKDGDPKLGLHYDLTVPLARYVAENRSRLTFPFRRYQIQSAWRGERPQLGRFREFLQADVDVIGQNTLDVRYDAELIAILRDTLQAMPIPPVRLLVNNRKLLEGFYQAIGIRDIPATLRLIDKLPKMGAEKVTNALVAAGVTPAQAEQCLAVSRLECRDPEELQQVRRMVPPNALLDQGLAELAIVLSTCRSSDRVEVVAALHIARGFDYYTGTVVEGVLAGHDELGSICSGGRYDDLAASHGTGSLPGVGVSIGITRIMAYCEHLKLLPSERRTPARVLVVVHTEDDRPSSDAVARQLRSRGIATLVSDAAAPYGQQIGAARHLGIRYLWFPPTEGEVHEVKDLQTRSQAPAEPHLWVPEPDVG